MGKKPSETGTCPAPINLEQARAELIRAEELLKQRHANTRLVLLKQKEITAQLQEAKVLVASLQRRMKEEVRQKERYRTDSMKKDAVIAELRLQLRKAGGQTNSQSVSHPQTPSEEDIRSVLSVGVREQPMRPARSARSGEPQKSRMTQRSARSGITADSDVATGEGRKRKGLELRGDGEDAMRDMLADMLDFVLDGAEPGASLQGRVETATDNYLEEFPAGEEAWAGDVARAAFGVLETCIVSKVACRWADMAWSPARWFEGGPSESPSRVGQARSLVATWCDTAKLQVDFIPWLIACLRRLEEKSRQRVTHALLDRCLDEVLALSVESDVRSVPILCCATTVAIVLCKMSGRRGLELGLKLMVDVLSRYCPESTNAIVAIAVALEVWPELGVVVTRSSLPLADMNEMKRNETSDIFDMASMTLKDFDM